MTGHRSSTETTAFKTQLYVLVVSLTQNDDFASQATPSLRSRSQGKVAECAEQREYCSPVEATSCDQGCPTCCLKMATTRSGSSGLKAGWTKPPRSSTTSLSFRGRLMSRGSQ